MHLQTSLLPDFIDEGREFFLNRFALGGVEKVERLAAELIAFFDQMRLIALPRQTAGCGHTGHTAA